MKRYYAVKQGEHYLASPFVSTPAPTRDWTSSLRSARWFNDYATAERFARRNEARVVRVSVHEDEI